MTGLVKNPLPCAFNPVRASSADAREKLALITALSATFATDCSFSFTLSLCAGLFIIPPLP